MRVLACDPGYDRLGIAVLERGADGCEILLHSDCLGSDRAQTMPERLTALGAALERLFSEYCPTHFALERLFFNKNQKTAIAVAEMRGILQYLAHKNGCSVHEFTPQEIKIAITGYGKSDKAQVTDMVKRLVPHVRDDALDDEYDAIAVGVTAIASIRQ